MNEIAYGDYLIEQSALCFDCPYYINNKCRKWPGWNNVKIHNPDYGDGYIEKCESYNEYHKKRKIEKILED